MSTVQTVPKTPGAPKVQPLKRLPLWEWRAPHTLRGSGRGASDRLGPACESPSSHVLLLTASKVIQNLLSEVSSGTFANTAEQRSLLSLGLINGEKVT